MENPTDNQRIEKLEYDLKLLKELIPSQIRSGISALEERMNKRQKELQESLVTMISVEQSKILETLKSLMLNAGQNQNQTYPLSTPSHPPLAFIPNLNQNTSYFPSYQAHPNQPYPFPNNSAYQYPSHYYGHNSQDPNPYYHTPFCEDKNKPSSTQPPTLTTNPTPITTNENKNQQPQNHPPQKSVSPSLKKTVTPSTNHLLTPIPYLNQKDPNIQSHNFSTSPNHFSNTQRRWRRKKRRWKIRKKLMKQKGRHIWVAASVKALVRSNSPMSNGKDKLGFMGQEELKRNEKGGGAWAAKRDAEILCRVAGVREKEGRAGGRWKSAAAIFMWMFVLEVVRNGNKKKVECLGERIEILGFITPLNFILGDIISHMAMKYSFGNSSKEIKELTSLTTIKSTRPANLIVSPYLYLDADYYPP